MSLTMFQSPRTPHQIQKMSPQHASVRGTGHYVRKAAAAYPWPAQDTGGRGRADGTVAPITAGSGQRATKAAEDVASLTMLVKWEEGS